jgi:NAD(P)-dependent dehydrogenase (short-subunit alcohol dehydrogenase family)
MSLQSLLNPTPPTPNIPRAAPPAPFRQQTWLVIGASRGIGLEFCTQLLAAGHRVIGTARAARGSSQLWTLTGTPNGKNLTILECDVTDEGSVERFVEAVRKFGTLKRGRAGGLEVVDVVVVNAGVLVYPNRAMEM